MAGLVRCEYCGRTFASPEELGQHVRVVHAGRPWAPQCSVCGVTFETPADLKAHNESVHHAPPS